MKGYELIEKITNGEIKDGTRIKVICDDYYVTCIEVKNNALIWESGKFTTSELCDKHVWFEIIEDKPDKIEKIKMNGNEFYSDYIDSWIEKNKCDAYCEYLSNKINELIEQVNYLLEKSDSE